MGYARVLVLIPTLNDDPSDAIESVMKQTVSPSKILVAVGSKELYQKLVTQPHADIVEYVYVKPNLREPVGLRVAKALNVLLSRVSLREYDYLVRVDADTILPPRFIEENLKLNADYVGKAGYAMILKIESFLKFLGGRFAEIAAEDTYVGLKLLSKGCRVESWILPPKLKRKSGSGHSWRYFYIRGIEMCKLGYEPIHIIERLRWDFRYIFAIAGYIVAILKRVRRYDVAHWVLRAQLRRLFRGRSREN